MPNHNGHVKTNSRASQSIKTEKIAKRGLVNVSLRNSRVEEFKAIARPIAAFYASCSPEPFDDLLQVGLMGLMRAAELYQPSRCSAFSAFAKPHVRGAILHYLRDAAPLIRLPRRVAELQQRAKQEGEQTRLGADLSKSQRKALEELTVWQQPISLDWLPFEELNLMALSTETMVMVEDSAAALEALQGLDGQMQWIVSKVVLEGWSYRRTAAHLQVSPMTVQRRLKAGLLQLKERLEQQQRSLKPGWRPDRFAAGGC